MWEGEVCLGIFFRCWFGFRGFLIWLGEVFGWTLFFGMGFCGFGFFGDNFGKILSRAGGVVFWRFGYFRKLDLVFWR